MRRQAFTLIEILVVVAIILLLTAIMLPLFKQTLDDSKVREGSRQLNSYLAMAKSRAASTGRPCGVYLDTQPTGICSQLYLAEVPPSYSGDFLETRVTVTDGSGNPPAADNFASPPAVQNLPWTINFQAASNGSLFTLIQDGETFGISFDNRDNQLIFPGIRSGNQFLITGAVKIPSFRPPYFFEWVVPKTSPGGFAFKITRSPIKVGQPLALPRGTAIDTNYSGLGNTGREFAGLNLTVMFSPDGHVMNTSQTLHFLVGRPEKVIAPLYSAESNVIDSKALWVSVATLTGSISTTDNAANVALPRSTPAEQTAFLLDARKFAREQDVKGN